MYWLLVTQNLDNKSGETILGSQVEVLATLPGRAAKLVSEGVNINADKKAGDILQLGRVIYLGQVSIQS